MRASRLLTGTPAPEPAAVDVKPTAGDPRAAIPDEEREVARIDPRAARPPTYRYRPPQFDDE